MAVLLKRAPDSGALFLFVAWALSVCPLLYASPSAADAAQHQCVAANIDEFLNVEYVHDGDTLHLADGQKVRLIGINTPELARDKSPAEAYGIEARDALRQLLKAGTRVGIQYGHERYDRHGRTLAHLYLEDGGSVQQWMLDKGYAAAITIPPNVHNAHCYQQAEQQARLAQRGIWQRGGLNAVDANALERSDQGFRLVKGRITKVKWTKKWLWLTLSPNCSLRIARADVHYFDDGLLASLAQKTVVARGWLTQRKGRWSMRIHHPNSLVIVDN